MKNIKMMLIRKLSAYILFAVLSAPCTASDGDYWQTQADIIKGLYTHDVKPTVVLKEFPNADYQIKEGEEFLVNYTKRIINSPKPGTIKTWKSLINASVDQGYQHLLKLIIAHAANNNLICSLLNEKHIKLKLSRLTLINSNVYERSLINIDEVLKMPEMVIDPSLFVTGIANGILKGHSTLRERHSILRERNLFESLFNTQLFRKSKKRVSWGVCLIYPQISDQEEHKSKPDEFVLDKFPGQNYVINSDEKEMYKDTTKLLEQENTIAIVEKWNEIVNKAIEQSYHYILRCLLEYMKENMIIQILLKEDHISRKFMELDKEIPGIYNYLMNTALTDTNSY